MKYLLDKQIKEIKKRADLARPGPWKSYVEGRDHEAGANFIMVGEGKNRSDDITLIGATVEDQDFIAHSRSDILFLLEEIERLKDKMN